MKYKQLSKYKVKEAPSSKQVESKEDGAIDLDQNAWEERLLHWQDRSQLSFSEKIQRSFLGARRVHKSQERENLLVGYDKSEKRENLSFAHQVERMFDQLDEVRGRE